MSILSVFPIGNGSGGSGGVAPSSSLYSVGPVKNVVATPDNGAIKLTWDDPEDLIQSGATVAEWAGTKVVYKEGGDIPVTPEDGVTTIYSTTRNIYSSEPLVVSGLAQETAYGINLFPYTKAGVVSHAVNTGKQLTTYGDMSLNKCSWAQIREISDAGTAANYWKIGDTKTIVINGQVGCVMFSNLSIDVFIIGFDHNAGREGKIKFTFKLEKLIINLLV